MLKSSIDIVINLVIDKSKLIDRLTNRFFCKNCNTGYNALYKLPKKEGICDVCTGMEFYRRDDDNKDTIENRFNVFDEQTKPILNYYKKQGILHDFSADKEPKLLSDEITTIVKKLLT